MMRLRTIGLAMVTAVALAASAAPAGATSETPNFQGDAGHSGGVSDPALAGPLHVLWTQRLTKGLTYPLVADGRVFVLSPATADGSMILDLVAVDAATGTVLWRRSLDHATHLTYGGGTVYAVNQGGLVVALDPATGVTRWANGPTALNISGVAAPPVYQDGLIYYDGMTYDEGATIVALDARDGSLRWHNPLTTYDADAGIAADDQGIYIGNECGFALSWTHAGAVRWSTRTPCQDWPSGFGEQMVMADGRVFTDARTGAVLDATSGSIVDAFARPSDGGLPAFGARHIAVLDHGRLTLSDRRTLTTTGTYTADNYDVSYLLGQPFFVGDRVFMEDNQHHLIGVDAATATVTANVDLDVQVPPVEEPPVDGSGGIAVGGGVIAVATTDGRLVGVTGPGGPTPAPPVGGPPSPPPPSTPPPPAGDPAPPSVQAPTPAPLARAVAADGAALPSAARRVTFPGGATLGLLHRRGLTLTVAGARPGATVDAILRARGTVLWRTRTHVAKNGRVRLAKARRAIRARTAQLEVRVSAAHARPLVVRRTLR